MASKAKIIVRQSKMSPINITKPNGHLTEMNASTGQADTGPVPVTVLYAVCAVPILEVAGSSVGVEDTQVLWAVNACRGTTTPTLIWFSATRAYSAFI